MNDAFKTIAIPSFGHNLMELLFIEWFAWQCYFMFSTQSVYF